MDRFEAMTLLLAAVEAGSLSAASRRLGRPLSTVSRRVAELETHLGARLLVRSGRCLALTEAGRGYVAAARRILDDEHVDVAVRIGALPDSSLVASRLGQVRRVVCASPGYLAEHGVPSTPEALAAHGCVTFDNLDRGEAWSFGEGAGRRRLAVRSRLVVDTAEAAIDAAIGGAGPTRLLSYQVADALRDGRLETVLAGFEPAPLPVSLVHGPRGPLPLKVRAFLDFARPPLARALQIE